MFYICRYCIFTQRGKLIISSPPARLVFPNLPSEERNNKAFLQTSNLKPHHIHQRHIVHLNIWPNLSSSRKNHPSIFPPMPNKNRHNVIEFQLWCNLRQRTGDTKENNVTMKSFFWTYNKKYLPFNGVLLGFIAYYYMYRHGCCLYFIS